MWHHISNFNWNQFDTVWSVYCMVACTVSWFLYLPFCLVFMKSLNFYYHQNRLFQSSTLENGDFFSVLPLIYPVILGLSSLDFFSWISFFVIQPQGPQAFPLVSQNIYYLIYHAPCTDIEISINHCPVFNLLPLICSWKPT